VALKKDTTNMKIVALDAHTLNPGDLSWEAMEKLGTLELYAFTPNADVVLRAKDADILLVNKVKIQEEHLKHLPKLRQIVVTATGYNNIDVAATKSRGITVCNAVGYSSASVAQHVFALILELSNQVGLHNQSVQAGDWSGQSHFCYWKKPLRELAGSKLGIFGYGRIGEQVATIGRALGMEILATRRNPSPVPGLTFVSVAELFAQSDVISLHAPVTDETRKIINTDLLKTMKPSAWLINTGRGELVNESALREALLHGTIAAAGIDVLDGEPPRADHPLFGLDNCIITPHQAWASKESRLRLMEITVENVAAFLRGAPQNVV
jgi:glycerate dehydrogenase